MKHIEQALEYIARHDGVWLARQRRNQSLVPGCHGTCLIGGFCIRRQWNIKNIDVIRDDGEREKWSV
jgi:hypothetical protein